MGHFFSGSRDGLSVNAFVERVEKYRLARSITEGELLNSLVDLLKDSALV